MTTTSTRTSATPRTQVTRRSAAAIESKGVVGRCLERLIERRVRGWILVSSLVAVGLAALLPQLGVLHDASRWVEDQLQVGRLQGYDEGVRLPPHRFAEVRGRGEQPARSREDPAWADLWDVAIVTLDDQSYRLLDGYPFTPQEDARVLRTLADLGAQVIVYDRLLAERRRKIVGPAGVEPMAEALAELAQREPPTRVVLASQLDGEGREPQVPPLPELVEHAEPGYLNLYHVEGDMIRDYLYRQHDHFSLAKGGYLMGQDLKLDATRVSLDRLHAAWFDRQRQRVEGNEHREPYLVPRTPHPRMLNFYAPPGEAFVQVSYAEVYRAYPMARVRALVGNAMDDVGRILEGPDFAEAWNELAEYLDHPPGVEDLLEVEPWLAKLEALHGEVASERQEIALDNLMFLLEDASAFAEEAHRAAAETLQEEFGEERAAVVALLESQRPELSEAFETVQAPRIALAEPDVALAEALVPERLAVQIEALERLLDEQEVALDARILFEDTVQHLEHLARLDAQLERIGQFPPPADPEEEALRRKLAGKHVLIGPWTLSSHDLYRVPVATGEMSRMYGVEIHATALQNLVDMMHRSASERTQQGLIRASASSVVGITMLATLLACLIAMFLQPLPGAAVLLLGAWGYFLHAQQVLVSEWLFLPLVIPFVGIGLAYGLVTVTKVLTIDEERRVVEDLFKSYMDRRFVELLKSDPKKVKLGGEQRPVTVYFSDIAGFSAISEKLEPEQLVGLINEYLGAMSEVILEHDGTVDKYIGDAIMAFWNAPMEVPDHAAKACLAAIEQCEKLRELQANWRERSLPAIGFRVGINTGEAVHGNMGSELKKNYTIMGDTVNLAARLEPLNKEFSTTVQIAEATYLEAQHAVEARCLGRVKVAGREEPVRFYELLGRKGEVTGLDRELVEIFHEALEAYIAGNLGDAQTLFEKAATLKPEDGPTEVYLRLIERFQHTPSDEPWSGIYVQTSK